MTVKRPLADNGAALRARAWRQTSVELGIKHGFTRPYRPHTNGKAERFIQSALREWTYGWTYANSAKRTSALASWLHRYNCHQPHSGIGGVAPDLQTQLFSKQPPDASHLVLGSDCHRRRWRRAALCSSI